MRLQLYWTTIGLPWEDTMGLNNVVENSTRVGGGASRMGAIHVGSGCQLTFHGCRRNCYAGFA